MWNDREPQLDGEESTRLLAFVAASDRDLAEAEPTPSARVPRIVDLIVANQDLADLHEKLGYFHLHRFVHRWFLDRYGDRAGGLIGPVGSWPFAYRGAVGTVRIPLVIGNPGQLPLTIDGLRPALVDDMTDDDIEPLKRLLLLGVRAFHDIQHHVHSWRNAAPTDASKLFEVAIGNVNSAVDAVSNHKLTDAAFLSQQGVEKALKAFGSHCTGQPWERTHDLPRLLDHAVAEEPGLAVFEQDVAVVNYRMDVRYGEVDKGPWGRGPGLLEQRASVSEAVRAVDIAIRVVGSLSRGVLPPPLDQP